MSCLGNKLCLSQSLEFKIIREWLMLILSKQDLQWIYRETCLYSEAYNQSNCIIY